VNKGESFKGGVAMALKKKLSTRKNIAKSLRKAQGKKTKKTVKKTPRKILKKRPAKKKAAKRKPVSKKKPALKKRKPAAKRPPKTKKTPKQEGIFIGSITHYFPHVQAAVIKLKEPLVMGNTIKIKGHTTDLTQAVTSIQIDRVDISNAKKGDEIGLQVSSRVRQGDKVYKI
jgi:putative protease